MSNLSSAKKAIAGKKRYIVTFEQKETFSVEVDALDPESASEEANEIFNNGGASSNQDIETQEISVNEAQPRPFTHTIR